ncbi:targeting protein for Xklp2 homolog [Anneissia japonica]|uniref:targeting protein for Xklp2 homolog n=1 Tax=Anneissia japonica TaxID=1529436 RepID=UPI0014257ABB|nr:targeting protein for Xklp2 homolog [Anneissia japonica]
MDDTLGHKWDFLAPQFVDFSKPDDSFDGDAEEYFNFDHENNIPLDIEESTNAAATKTQIPSSGDDTQNFKEELKPICDGSSNSPHKMESSDVEMKTSPLRITKPSVHLSSGSDSQEDGKAEHEASSLQVHTVAPNPPVFRNEDIPAPPKITQHEDSEGDTSAMETEDSPNEASTAVAPAAVAPATEAPATKTPVAVIAPLVFVAPEADDAPVVESPKAEAPAGEAKLISLPAFNADALTKVASPEIQASPVKVKSPVAQSIEAEVSVENPRKPANLVTSWTTSSETKCVKKPESTVAEIKQTEAPVDKLCKPANIVTSWGTCSNAKTASKPATPVSETTKKRRGSEGQVDNHRVTRSMNKLRRSVRLNPRRSNPVTPTPSTIQTPSSKRRRTDLTITTKSKPSGIHKLVMPQTPTFMKRKMHFTGEKAKKTEELELEKINEFQKQMAKTRKMAEESYKKLQVSTNYVPVRSQQPITRPKEFEFSTDARITKTGPAVPRSVSEEDFFSSLRKHTQPQKQSKGPTKPQPFNFQNQHKSDHFEQPSIPKRFQSMAEQVAAFQVRTPERFQSWKRRQQNKGPAQPVVAPKLTCPKTPALETRKRKRPSTVVSAKDKEDKEVEDMKTGLPEAKPNVLTCPKSPAFALKNRKRLHENDTKPEEEKPVVKARPAPHVGVPFAPNLQHKTTEPQPFSFASRDEATVLKKEEKIQQLFKEEQKLREFKAQLMPILDTVSGVPEKKTKKGTEIKPFGFHQEDVGAKRAQDWSKKMAEELEKERNQTFHAKEANVLYRKPFIPQKSDKPLTEISDFMLNSEKRAEQRQQYETQKRMREIEITLEKAELERQNALREQKEVAQMRAAMVPKSNPIRQYKPVEIEHSEKPLTQPVTPKFSDRLRNRTIL